MPSTEATSSYLYASVAFLLKPLPLSHQEDTVPLVRTFFYKDPLPVQSKVAHYPSDPLPVEHIKVAHYPSDPLPVEHIKVAHYLTDPFSRPGLSLPCRTTFY